MKNYKLLLSTFAGVAVLFATFATFAAQADDKAGVVTLIRLVGNAEYSLDGGHVWIPAVVGKDFQPGTIIRTEDKSLADVLVGQSLPDRNVRQMLINSRHNPAPNNPPVGEKNIIRLQPNTILGVDKLTIPDNDPTVVSDCELNLKKGRILASVRKVSPSAEYLVKIPNGVAAVRGTQFALSVEGPDISCQVVNGTVWLSLTLVDSNGNPLLDASGNPLAPVQISITPGQGFDLTPALISQLNAIAAPGGTTANNVQGLINQLTSLASSAVTTLGQNQETTLTLFFAGLQTTSITITAPNGTVLPPDNGTPPFISP